MDDGRFAPAGGPADGQDVEAGGLAELAVLVVAVARQVRAGRLRGGVQQTQGPSTS